MTDDANPFLSLLTGSFSTPAGGNPTVAMVEAAYRDLGLRARYINCEVAPAGLGDAVRGARAMGWAGFNCSLPHKVAVIGHLDRLAASAELIGAVNCVVLRDGALVGENTDGQGFVAALRGVADPAGQRIVVFGAGGAARAIAVEAALAGAAALTIVNRDRQRGAELAALLNERTSARAEAAGWDGPYRIPEGSGIVVNATSIGGARHPGAAGAGAGQPARRHGRRRRDTESAAHRADRRRAAARLHRARWPRHAGRAGVDRHRPLDRPPGQRGGDARGAGCGGRDLNGSRAAWLLALSKPVTVRHHPRPAYSR